jgi:hypothetical protein
MQFWLQIRIARDARVCLVFHFLITGCSTTVTDGWKQFNGKRWQVTVLSCGVVQTQQEWERSYCVELWSCSDTTGVGTELLC